jgi:hypothetical protein
VPKVSPSFSSLPLVDTSPDRPGALTQPFWPAMMPNLEVHIDRSENADVSELIIRIFTCRLARNLGTRSLATLIGLAQLEHRS